MSRHRPRTLVTALDLPDPDHVLAAAIRAHARVIVTNNLKDFPAQVMRQRDIDPEVVWSCVQQIANSWRNPPGTIGDVLASLERCGLVQSVAALRAL
ncbi:hypothetical protein ACSHWB_19540 [Lentzea sp. HUAS TT2]|uniref:hypothetical protein n=1 Tax=Lentzea sp. HUAS TT2 TaxID=3447454 RepID=UPI003F71786D